MQSNSWMFRPLVTFPFAQQHHTTVHAYNPPAAVTSSRPLVTFAQQTTVWKTGSNGLESTVRPLVWISLGLSTTTVWCGVVSVGREMVGCGSALLPHWNQIGAVSVWILAHYQVYARPGTSPFRHGPFRHGPLRHELINGSCRACSRAELLAQARFESALIVPGRPVWPDSLAARKCFNRV